MIIFYICKNVQYIHFLFTRCEISKMESQNHLIQSFVYKTVISGKKLFHCKISITVLEINLHNADDQMMDYILDICLYKGLFLILQKLFSEVSQAPPSAITVVPVRSSPAELAMYSTALPMSSRRPRRWTGIDFTKSSVILFPPTKFIQYCYNIM